MGWSQRLTLCVVSNSPLATLACHVPMIEDEPDRLPHHIPEDNLPGCDGSGLQSRQIHPLDQLDPLSRSPDNLMRIIGRN